MRAEKPLMTAEYVARLQRSSFFILVNYKGLTVAHFSEMRSRLKKANAEVHVVKNSVLRAAAKETEVADLTGALVGQLAIVTGQRDIAAAAKILKSFRAEFEKPNLQFGYLGNERVDAERLILLAELPSVEVLRGNLVGVLMSPISKLVRVLSTPASQLAWILEAKVGRR